LRMMNASQSNPGDYSPPISADHADDPEEVTITTIPPEYGGRRLDAAWAKMFPDHSRSRLQGWLKDGLIRVDDAAVDGKRKVWGGEQGRMGAARSVQGLGRTA